MSVGEPDVSAKVAPDRARIEWPTGHADVVPERTTDFAAEIRTIHGRRSAFRPQPPTPSIALVDHPIGPAARPGPGGSRAERRTPAG